MTAPVFVLDPAAMAGAAVGATLVLDGPEGHHAANVRRIGVGERVDLVDGHGRRIHALVQSADRSGLTLEVEQISDEDEQARARDLIRRALSRRRRPAADDTAECLREKRRLVGMLARKGYAAETAYAVVNSEWEAAAEGAWPPDEA